MSFPHELWSTIWTAIAAVSGLLALFITAVDRCWPRALPPLPTADEIEDAYSDLAIDVGREVQEPLRTEIQGLKTALCGEAQAHESLAGEIRELRIVVDGLVRTQREALPRTVVEEQFQMLREVLLDANKQQLAVLNKILEANNHNRQPPETVLRGVGLVFSSSPR